VNARRKTALSVGWFTIGVGVLLGVATVFGVVIQPPTELSVIELFIGGVIAVSLVAFGMRLRQRRSPPQVEVLPRSEVMPGAGQTEAYLLGWFAMVCGALLGAWSVYNVATRTRPNELDVIDLLLGVVIAVTLVAFGMRLRQRRSPWRPFLLGFTVSVILFALALVKAFQGFNG
jgi:predicted permease